MRKNKSNKVPQVVPGSIVEITERTCSDKLQPNIKVHNRFIVVNVTELKNGTPAIEVKSPLAMGKITRINAERFRWRIVTMEEIQKVQEFKHIQQDGREKNAIMKEKFNDEEIDHILFTPFIYELLAWHYVDLCHRHAAENKLNYNKISRMAVEKHKEAQEEGSFELGENVYSQFEYGVKVLTEEYEKELFRIWWQVNGEIKREYPDTCCVELKTYAICGMLAVRLLDEREEKSDNLIKDRLGGILEYKHKAKRSNMIHDILKGYAEEAVNIDYKRLEMSTMVLRNNIECIKFNTLHQEFRKNY